ncbi:MAG: hypothetical protein UF438_02390 [Oribacterium sp.]|nr:hypothetical protein [Oribacterium sp.]
MARKTEKKAGLPMAVALVALLLFVSVVGIVVYVKKARSGGPDETETTSATADSSTADVDAAAGESAPDAAAGDEEGEDTALIDETLDDVPHAYQAYLEAVDELEASFGTPAAIESAQGYLDLDASHFADLSGLCLLQLIDFNRDGLDELVAGYREPTDGSYHFRVYGYAQGQLHMYIDSIMGGVGQPVIYELATETLNDGQEYLITHDGIRGHRIYGFDATGHFMKRIEIGAHQINGEPVYDNSVVKAMRAWIADEQTSYPMTMLQDADVALQAIEATRTELEDGAALTDPEVLEAENPESANADDAGIVTYADGPTGTTTDGHLYLDLTEVGPAGTDESASEHATTAGDVFGAAKSVAETTESEDAEPPKPRAYTAKQLLAQIHDVTDDSIADYLYADFDGDGVRDLVALSLHCTTPKETGASDWSAIYAAPDGSKDSGDAMRFSSGTDYTLSWWFANGEQVYTFDSMRAPVVTGAKLLKLETDVGLQLAATVYWEDEDTDAVNTSAGASLFSGTHSAAAYAADAGANQGGLSATRQTDSTSLIYRFDDSGATELFREDGYRLSNPGANRIGFSSVHYTKGDDGCLNESCAYGTLRYNTADDSYQEYAF